MNEQPPAALAPSVALAPCPFCGHGESLYVEHVEGTILHPSYFVRCDYCGAVGPSTDHGNHAEKWNARASLAQQGEAEAWMVGPKRDAMLQMLLAASEDIDEMARRTGPSRFPSVEQLRGWRRMINSIMAALQETSAPQSAQEGAEVQRLRELALCVYVGPAAAHDLPENWLDALSSAGHGEAFSCDGLIPYTHPAAVDEAMVERAIVAGMATRPREYPPNWPGDYDADEQEHGRNFMRAALTAALHPAATSEESP